MVNKVRDSYDAMAERYTEFALGDLDRVPSDRGWLETFAELVGRSEGVVADLGCGPGYVVDYLGELGVPAVGYDISPGLVAEARRAFPDSHFEVGDFEALEIADSSISGIVARYSLIHFSPTELGGVFQEWSRMLQPGAPILLSFFASPSVERHGEAFYHAVVEAYQLFPATIMQHLKNTGFDRGQSVTRNPIKGERLIEHGTILARKSDG